jgi:hypothetical protein
MVTGDREPAIAVLYCPPARPGLALTLNRVRSAATARPVPIPCTACWRSLYCSGYKDRLSREPSLGDHPSADIRRYLLDGEPMMGQPLTEVTAISADMTDVTWVRRRVLARAGCLPVDRDLEQRRPSGAQDAVYLGQRRSIIRYVL